MKIVKKIIGIFDYKLVEKNLIKNTRDISSYTNLNLKNLIENYIRNYGISYLIQIGANDGKRFDEINFFIKKYKIKSLLVEPIESYFQKLKKNYKNLDFVKFENSAISVENEISYLFKVKEKYLNNYDDHINGLASFDKNHLIKHGVKKHHIERTKTNTVSISELINKYKINELGLLFVDAEGYDRKIVYDFFINSNMKPIVIFEFIHIENKLFKKLLELMVNKKYYFFRVEENLICYPQGREFII